MLGRRWLSPPHIYKCWLCREMLSWFFKRNMSTASSAGAWAVLWYIKELREIKRLWKFILFKFLVFEKLLEVSNIKYNSRIESWSRVKIMCNRQVISSWLWENISTMTREKYIICVFSSSNLQFTESFVRDHLEKKICGKTFWTDKT